MTRNRKEPEAETVQRPKIDVLSRPGDRPVVREVRPDRPVLTYGHHAFYGDCWTLWYRDESGRLERNCIPGTLTDVDAAVAAATEFLAPLDEPATMGMARAEPKRLPGRSQRRGVWAAVSATLSASQRRRLRTWSE